MGQFDAVTAEILRHKLQAIVRDMGAVIANTSASPSVSERGLLSAGLVREDGALVATDNPLHLAPLHETAKSVLDYFQFDTNKDDLILTNDPYSGCGQIHYCTLLAPYSHEEAIAMYLIVRCHIPDLGGSVPGGYNPIAQEVWAEGARFTPVKLYREGKLQRDLLTTFLLNSRAPEISKGNVDALMAGLEAGKRRLKELVSRYGFERVAQGADYCLHYAEDRVRAEIERWPDGEYHGESTLDHDYRGGVNVAVRATVRIKGGEAEVDLSESDPQTGSFINSTRSNTIACALMPFLLAMDETVPKNSGILNAIKVKTKEGTVVHAGYPAATAFSPFHVGAEIISAVTEALSHFLPDRSGGRAGISPQVVFHRRLFGAIEASRFQEIAMFQGGGSAACKVDGWGAPVSLCPGLLPSVEMSDMEGKVTVLKMELLKDSCGPGKWRGAPGTETIFSFRGDEGFISVCAQGTNHPVAGLAGGAGGSPNRITVRSGNREVQVEEMLLQLPLEADTLVEMRMGGGGGWGNPHEREEQAVLADVEDGYLSVEAAMNHYGVVISPASMQIDRKATRDRRRSGGRPDSGKKKEGEK